MSHGELNFLVSKVPFYFNPNVVQKSHIASYFSSVPFKM